MLIRQWDSVEGQTPQMDGVKDVTMRVMIGRDDETPNFALRHFIIEPDGHTPRHSHNYEHQNYIVAGSGKIWYGTEFYDIKQGDYLYVEPNVEHQFVNTGDEPLAFICLVPMTFQCGDEGEMPVPGS